MILLDFVIPARLSEDQRRSKGERLGMTQEMRLKGEFVEGLVDAITPFGSNDARDRSEEKRKAGSAELMICSRRRKDAIKTTMTVLIQMLQYEVQDFLREIGDGGVGTSDGLLGGCCERGNNGLKLEHRDDRRSLARRAFGCMLVQVSRGEW